MNTPAPPLGADAAYAAIMARVQPVQGHERRPVREALGRVLAEDLIAPFDVPAHDNSAMDGYAVRAADLAADMPTTLTVVGDAYAGRPFSGQVGAGHAVRIMTGAMIPDGADTIVIQEHVERDGVLVRIAPGVRAGQNLRRAGEDLAAGSVALARGRRLGPAELGLIASLGIAEVRLTRRLRVAFLSTGDEIATIGRALGPGQVYDSNRYTLFGLLSRLGCELIDLGVVADEPQAMETAFRSASASADAVITSGGVSVGEADFVRTLMARLGQVDFWKLAIKPGRPMAFGRMGDAWLFGLPGNPVAVMVTYLAFVQDALLRMMGVDPLPSRPVFLARCRRDLRKQAGRREYLRARLHPGPQGWEVEPAPAQGSGILRSMSEADCFIVLDETNAGVTAGTLVTIVPFEGLFP